MKKSQKILVKDKTRSTKGWEWEIVQWDRKYWKYWKLLQILQILKNTRNIGDTANTDNIVKMINNESSDFRWDEAHPDSLYCVNGVWHNRNDCKMK